jgi:hypothetical protein
VNEVNTGSSSYEQTVVQYVNMNLLVSKNEIVVLNQVILFLKLSDVIIILSAFGSVVPVKFVRNNAQ